MIKARVRKRDGRRVYDVRLRDPSGNEYSRTFETKRSAEDFERAERTDRRRGEWLDPRQADLTWVEVAQRWLATNPAKRANTRATDESNLRRIVPVFGPRRIGISRPQTSKGSSTPGQCRWHLGPSGASTVYGPSSPLP
jgi:hypothetical protein